jgi:hypothetical protein
MPSPKRKRSGSRRKRKEQPLALALSLPQLIIVPADQVGETVQAFIDNDEIKDIAVVEQPDGTFKVIPLR